VLDREQRTSVRPRAERLLTANPAEAPVIGGLISPNGKYLAFSDKTGFYLRHVETGETHPVPLPTGLALKTVGWFPEGGVGARPLSWFPDGVHLVVGWVTRPEEQQSLWAISVVGGTARKRSD